VVEKWERQGLDIGIPVLSVMIILRAMCVI